MSHILQLAITLWVSGAAAAGAPDGQPPEPCFAPGTPPQLVLDTYRALATGWREAQTSLDPYLRVPRFEFSDGSRWSFTTTDGFVGGQGNPTILTWSILPDGTPIPAEFPGSPLFESSDPSGLRAFLDGVHGSEAVWLPLFEQVFDRFAELTGITYVYEPNDDGGAFPTSTGQLGTRGDVRIGGHPIDGDFGVLAYNFFPNNGDMVLDIPDSFFDNDANTLGLRNTLGHEHGHGLGIRHVCPLNGTKLMEPFIATGFEGPQHDDVQAASRGYGDRFEHNDTPGTATPLGPLGAGATLLDEVSIDDDGDVDFYSFSLGTGTLLDVTLEPVGTTYLSGEQGTPTPGNPSGCTAGVLFDSLTIHDLAVTVLDQSGTSELAIADDFGTGVAETLIDLDLGAGSYLVEVAGDATDALQLYRLTLGVESATEIFADGFESGDPSAWSATLP